MYLHRPCSRLACFAYLEMSGVKAAVTSGVAGFDSRHRSRRVLGHHISPSTSSKGGTTMSKFNIRSALRTGVSAVRSTERPTGFTFEGAPGYARDPKSELFLLAITSFVAEDTFYEGAADRDARLRDLVSIVAVEDFEWTLRFVTWLRNGAFMRSAATVVAAEAVKARLAKNEPGGNRALVRAALQRADEPGEFLAYWTSRYGRRLPQP